MAGGCALYGHSCYGGHGKRSEPQISNEENQFPQNPFRSDPNKELRVFCFLNCSFFKASTQWKMPQNKALERVIERA